MGMLKFRWGYVTPVLLSRVLLATMPVQKTERKRGTEPVHEFRIVLSQGEMFSIVGCAEPA